MTRPDIAAHHVRAYGQLLKSELGSSWRSIKLRALLGILALVFFLFSALLAAMAAMLWSVSAGATVNPLWILLGVPLLPLVLGGLCLAFRQPFKSVALVNTRKNIQEDLSLLKAASSP